MMKISPWKQAGTTIIATIVVIVSFAGGVYFGSNGTLAFGSMSSYIAGKDPNQPANVDFSPFWEAWSILNNKYVATKSGATTTDKDKVWGAIKGLAESYGDPYTTFFPPAQAQQFKEGITGNFEGVGMELDFKDGVLTVVSPIKDAPAFKAGIKAGDRILKIDNAISANMTGEQAVKLIRGKKGTSVTLTVIGKDEKTPHDVKIIRDVIDVPTLKTEMKNNIFVIHLYTFTSNSQDLFRTAIREFIDSGSHKLVLDLRGNPGGYLDSAVDMASWFLPSDAIVVKEDMGGNGTNEVYKSKGYNIFSKELSMVILVDGGSASASEILAGALQEHGIAKLLGEKTFGKGSVQELVALTPDTSLKITIARWLTPNGVSISEHGLKPDIELKASSTQATAGIDNQLDAAVNLLLER